MVFPGSEKRESKGFWALIWKLDSILQGKSDCMVLSYSRKESARTTPKTMEAAVLIISKRDCLDQLVLVFATATVPSPGPLLTEQTLLRCLYHVEVLTL